MPPQRREPRVDAAFVRTLPQPAMHCLEENQTTPDYRHVLECEFSHRVKNLVAVIQSITRQTLRSTPDPERFRDAFLGRIASLASTYSILADTDCHGRAVDNVIQHQLEPLICDASRRLKSAGPSVFLSADVATQLGLALHELATNAIKFGALSGENGHIEIEWERRRSVLHFTWRECGGPPVVPPTRAGGFGSKLIDMSVRNVERRYEPDGLRISFTLALPNAANLDTSAIEVAENEGWLVNPDMGLPNNAWH